MPIDTDVLTLTQWMSPTFPVGAYAYSHGLEWVIESGDVMDPATTQEWIQDVLRHGAGRTDCILLAVAYQAPHANALMEIDLIARSFAASKERWQETDLQGAAFCDAVAEVWGHRLPRLVYPVAVGRAATLQALPLELCAAMYLHGFLSNLAAAAMRLVPLGQTDGQRIIHDLTPLVAILAREARNATLDDISTSSFLGDIAAMKHETQYSRIFRT